MSLTWIAVAGKIASGKSTVGKAIAKELGYPIISFGGLLRTYSLSNSLPTDRESLQELGQRQIDTLGEEGFVDWIIANTSDFDWKKYFVFEGFRHEGCYKRFLALYPSTILVYCQIDIQTQIQRMKKRDGLDETKALSVLHHATEQSVEKLEQYATVLNNTNLTLENVVKIILTFA